MKKSKREESNPATLRFVDLDQAKTTVTASLRSPGSRRCYEHAIIIDWYCGEPRLGFNKAVVTGRNRRDKCARTFRRRSHRLGRLASSRRRCRRCSFVHRDDRAAGRADGARRSSGFSSPRQVCGAAAHPAETTAKKSGRCFFIRSATTALFGLFGRGTRQPVLVEADVV
jgi:hypothetical protein